MFRRTVTIRFDEADARGVLFYGRVQALAHRVFEDFVVSELVERWEDWFESARVRRAHQARRGHVPSPDAPGTPVRRGAGGRARWASRRSRCGRRFVDRAGAGAGPLRRGAHRQGVRRPGDVEEDADPVSDPRPACSPTWRVSSTRRHLPSGVLGISSTQATRWIRSNGSRCVPAERPRATRRPPTVGRRPSARRQAIASTTSWPSRA